MGHMLQEHQVSRLCQLDKVKLLVKNEKIF